MNINKNNYKLVSKISQIKCELSVNIILNYSCPNIKIVYMIIIACILYIHNTGNNSHSKLQPKINRSSKDYKIRIFYLLN